MTGNLAGVDLLVEQVREAAAARRALRIRGGGTKDFYGRELRGEILDTRSLAGILAYSPSELVVTARAGTLLADLEARLASSGQFLPFEPPQFSGGTTLGGVVACGLSGPARQARGGLRDFVLGAQLLDGRGQVLRFGGQVMKNVAGFDVARTLAGSLGTLGVILEVSLKVLPRPQTSATHCFALEEAAALERVTGWAGRPLPISATAWSAGTLAVRLSGSLAPVRAAAASLGGEVLAPTQADALWADVRDQRAAAFGAPGPLWRITLPAGRPPLELARTQCFEWGGTLRWLTSDLPGTVIRAASAQLGGHATLFRASPEDKARSGVFTRRSASVAAIEGRLKAAFDPQGIFNQGRVDAA
jgi:glycolate oxidase FAD binding subunit